MVDRTTRWPEAIPLSNIAVADCAAALFTGWIQRFGVPAIITSDRGAQFTSSLWTALCSLLSINHVTTATYHPQSNRLVERFHRRLKEALRARLATSDWMLHLPWVLLSIRTALPLEGGPSPAEAVMGCQPSGRVSRYRRTAAGGFFGSDPQRRPANSTCYFTQEHATTHHTSSRARHRRLRFCTP